jgi:hypothetical protein
MSSRDQMDEKLERLVGQALRAQPPRRAPASLEERVLREIAARARLPWWRRGMTSWPLAVRIPVIAGSAISVPLVWIASVWLATRLASVATHSGNSGPLASVRDTGHAIASLGTLASHIVQSIPREWLLGGLIATATLYAALFALVALGYSLLYPRTEYSKAQLT